MGSLSIKQIVGKLKVGCSFCGKGVGGRIFVLCVLTKLWKGSSGPLHHLVIDCGMRVK